MTTSLVFYAFFSAVDTGVIGLAITVDLDSINRANGVRTALVTGGSATELRDGSYSYRYDADPTVYDYICCFKTIDVTVDYQHILSAWQNNTDSLIFAAQFITGLVGATGLTVTADVDSVNRSTGARTAISTGVAATEGRDGYYFYRVASPDLTTNDYLVMFKTTDVTVEYRTLPALQSNFAYATSAIAALLAYPLSLIAGDDYNAADARSFDYTVTDQPSLIGATVTFRARRHGTGTPALVKSLSVLNATSVRLELTDNDTALFGVGLGTYTIVATLADGNTVTLISSSILVQALP